MASHEYGSVTVGEYKYTVSMYDEGAYWVAPGQKFARAKVLDNTKASYAKAAENVTFRGETIPVLSFANTYAGCTNLVVAPEIPSSVTNMYSCFAACTSLTTAPTIPASVAGMDSCFSGCTALVNPPDMSAAVNVVSMSASFYQCTALVDPPTMPETMASSSDANVYGMSQAFRSCTSLKTAPTIPSGVANMTYCFADCSSLESVPKIPSTVKGMSNAFSGCASLSGSIVVANTPTSWGNIFTGTTNVLYIIPVGDADISTWHTIANAYSNVIFLAEANAKPALSFSVTRVSASGQTNENIEGTWAYIVAVATAYYDHLPEGYTNAVGAITLTANGSSTSPTWVSDSIVEGEYKVTETRHTWLQISTIRHVFAMSVVDSYDASSPTITVKLPSTNTLLDFLPGGNGMAIGKVATRDAFDCVIPAYFDDVEVDGDLKTAGHVLDMSGNAKYLPLSGGIEMETDTSYFTPNATNVDLASFHATTYGKVCMLTIGFQPKAAWAASAPLTIGTVASAYRSAWRAGGANVNVSAQMSTAGVITARNITGVQLNAGVTQYVEMVYLLA